MKKAYTRPKNWTVDTRLYVDRINKVIDEYTKLGFRLTLRQLYYQLVARDLIVNELLQYKRLSRILTEARLSGIIDWDIIEDRIRIPKLPTEFFDVKELIDVAIDSYRRYRWNDQKNYIEVWVEKDALAGVLENITTKYHVRLLVNRGYSSITAMHDASLRIRYAESKGKNCYILYIGDHDPSGEDMVRDINKRLHMFGCNATIEKLALTMEQIKKYNPPPNRTKRSDPRTTKYIAKHGKDSWEVDALKPDVLNRLVERRIKKLCDLKKYEKVIKKETREKKRLKEFTDEFDE